MARPNAADVQRETQAAAAGAGMGLKCPRCHCQNFRVLETRPGEDSKVRRRVCRACGYVFVTGEFVTSDLPVGGILEHVMRKLLRRD